MATVHPFRALRPRREHVQEIVGTVPREVISVEDAKKIVTKHPQSFLRVIKPEVDLDNGAQDNLYEQGAANLRKLLNSEYYRQEEEPALYVYQLVDGGNRLTGIFGCVPVGEYEDGTIVRHEKTRPAKEKVRMKHLLALKAHPEPVMLIYRSDEEVAGQIDAAQSTTEPVLDFTDGDQVRHVLWKIPNTTDVVEAFGRIPCLYVADGHHRCEAASRAAAVVGEEDGVSSEIQFFPAVLFPMDQMRIRAYNRVVYDLPMTSSEFLDRLEEISHLERNVSYNGPQKKGDVCIFVGDSWHRFELPPATRSAITSDLDVAKLSDHILKPLIGITDSRIDKNLGFVSGNEGPERLAEMVNEGIADVAFSLYPTSVEELVQVADAGELMPPKSTWFEPKLKSGLLIHSFRTEEAVNSSSVTLEHS